MRSDGGAIRSTVGAMGAVEVFSAAGGVLVIDPDGGVFSALRSAKLGVALWRITRRVKPADIVDVSLAAVATNGQPDWGAIAELADRVRTVVISTHHDEEHAGRALAVGAFGYVSVTLEPDALRRTILGALNGEPAYSRRVLAERLRSTTRPHYSGRALSLTPRQREVVLLIAQGAADKEIARTLGITTATAQKHVTNLLKRLNVPNRAAAAAVLVSSTAWIAPERSYPTPNALVDAAAAAS
jgi:DNA-binding NarL/FixJ family response regulator